MKNLFFTVFVLFTSLTGQAQQLPNDVTLTYSISITAPQNENIAKAFNGAVYTVYLKAGESRTEMVSSLGTESDIYNNKTGKGVILKEYSGQKLMITLTRENWKQKNLLFHNLHFNFGTNSSKIGSFDVLTAEGSMEGKPITIYYSKLPQLPNTDYNNAFSKIIGTPVKYDLKSGNLTFTYTLNSISYDIIPASKFELPKTGFRIMSYEENQQLKKGTP